MKKFKPKRWIKYSEADLIEFVSSQSTRLSERTIALYRRNLKTFFGWLAKTNNVKNPAELIKISSKETATEVTRDSLITPEEFEAMLRAADSIRDKALLFVMWESGARLSEIIGMKIRDVEIDSELIRISVRGKTGHRVIPLISASPYLQQWLEAHPRKGDPEAPLWISYKRGHFGEVLRETSVQKNS